MTPATEEKRKELKLFIGKVLKPKQAVQAVIGIDSIASGCMRSDSDIDIVVAFEPMDWYIIPTQFIRLPSDGTYHSILTQNEEAHGESPSPADSGIRVKLC